MSCQHDWVFYEPLFGDGYKCCSKAGCGIKYQDWLNEGVVAYAPPTIYTPSKTMAEIVEPQNMIEAGKISLSTPTPLELPKGAKTIIKMVENSEKEEEQDELWKFGIYNSDFYKRMEERSKNRLRRSPIKDKP